MCIYTWCESHAVGEHGALDDVEVGPDVEGEEAEADHAEALHGDDDERVHGGGARRRLEAHHAHRAQEGEDLGDAEGDEEHPHPDDLLGAGDLGDVGAAAVDLDVAEGRRLVRPDLRRHQEHGHLGPHRPEEDAREAQQDHHDLKRVSFK